MTRRRAFSAALLLSLATAAPAAAASFFTGHSHFSVTSAVSIAEQAALRFGNFSVSSPGDSGASITLDPAGARTVQNNSATTITLLQGGGNTGAQGAGVFAITGAGAGATLYVSFVDHGGAAITAGNPVVLNGPVGADTFNVDSFTFNLDGTDGTGDYITASGLGTASVRVGATLRTAAGATTYTPGTYRGTYQILVSY